MFNCGISDESGNMHRFVRFKRWVCRNVAECYHRQLSKAYLNSESVVILAPPTSRQIGTGLASVEPAMKEIVK